MKSSTDPILVAAAADANYALPLAVMLRSAADHLAPGRRMEAHVVDDDIGAALREKVKRSLPPCVDLHWITRPRDEFATLPVWGRISRTTYQKLTLAHWLPEAADRVIWLDCDTLVLADLAQLWALNLSGQVALAAQDVIIPRLGSLHGVNAHAALRLDPASPYFNSGVMLIDLAQWRAAEVGTRATDYLQRHSHEVYFWDQEGLNVALYGRWGMLDQRWNWGPMMTLLTTANRNRSHEMASASRGATEPWIVHFLGNLKPWRYPGTTFFHTRYYEWLDRTAWSGWRPASTIRGRLVAAYEASRWRTILYPLEQYQTRIVRWWTRK